MKKMNYVVCLVLLLAMIVATAGMPYAIPRRAHRIHLRQRPNTMSTQIQSVAREYNFIGLELKSVVCIPTATETLEDHEGRHTCAYDHPKGFRAVGVAYNLDDDVKTRKSELGKLFLDYDKVYSGESCLWDIQISALLTLDAKRALNKAADSVEPLDDFCCEVQAVFADVQHSIGASKSLSGRDLKNFVEKASAGEWTSAAHELKESDWCYYNKERCDDNIETLKNGCDKLSR